MHGCGMVGDADLMAFFRSEADRKTQSSARTYHKALSSLSGYLSDSDQLACGDVVRVMEGWLVGLSLKGLSPKTLMLYLDIVAGLYGAAVKAGIASESKVFKVLKDTLRAIGREEWERSVTSDDFDRLLNMAKTASHVGGELSVSTDLVLYSLLNGAVPVAEVAQLKRDDVADDAESRAIVERHVDRRRRYVFGLNQSGSTPRQVEHRLNQLVGRLFQLRNIAMGRSVDDTIEGYWAYAALRAGSSPRDVVAALGKVPSALPVLRVCGDVPFDADRRLALSRDVAELLMVNPLRWYAMRLRPRVKFADIESRFEMLGNAVKKPRMFYPSEEIAKRIGKKLVYHKRPVIADVVFFNSRVTDIMPLFGKIGDLAWCYTTTGQPGAPYAAISRQAFERFQDAIGQFTPDYEVAPIGKLEPREGDKVVIVGGLLQGRSINVRNVTTANSRDEAASPGSGTTIYRFQFDSQNGFEWKVSVPSRLIDPSN